MQRQSLSERETIYLDNAATTRVAPEVVEVAAACMAEDYGNPASAHHVGITAERRVAAARATLLAALGDPDGELGDVVWTSGGTEGDAMGVLGGGRGNRRRGHKAVLSAIEHSAVRESTELLKDDGLEVEVVPVSSAGVVDPAEVAGACRGAAVAAVMLVNNEIGVIQPVADIAAGIRAINPDVHIHCDAVQALGKIPIDVAELGIDSLAVAAHKLHGPKGVGALWLRKGARLAPLWGGGGQQGGLRSGTLNVPGIAAFGAAVELAGTFDPRPRYDAFAERLIAAARESGADVRINGAGAPRAPHILSLAFRGCPAEPLLHVLESRAVMVSAGSACSERDRRPSHVLAAIGLEPAYGTLRFSFGRYTTDGDIDRACTIVRDAVRSFL